MYETATNFEAIAYTHPSWSIIFLSDYQQNMCKNTNV